ncbi:TetR family transcriptional regulator [Haloechinothrix sp. YIM 98757]|uniref:TetR family transcriptional regulator n=1 Tax=Haloechinothrix aidingensis TaxID=2752311 RepID=A0A837ZZP5_9PSEU|nr:TetR family transcriptional regulator [Haloechinothrix aidingensis]MBA0126076.1 TetR family transcriptional regulator [Haloechinothrix aidingensis]
MTTSRAVGGDGEAGASSPGRAQGRRGPNDPDRRNRIARAAISVVAEQGIDALTHRRVAAQAGVPLGSTTYHFATMDDLVAVALEQAAEGSITQLREWERSLDPGVDLADALADFVVRSLTEHREHTIVEYNLYALALHRPHLRKAAADWDNAMAELFGSRTDPMTGRMVAALFCGLLMQAVLVDETPEHGEIATLFRRALSGNG